MTVETANLLSFAACRVTELGGNRESVPSGLPGPYVQACLAPMGLGTGPQDGPSDRAEEPSHVPGPPFSPVELGPSRLPLPLPVMHFFALNKWMKNESKLEEGLLVERSLSRK